jgi:hypothetical protein
VIFRGVIEADTPFFLFPWLEVCEMKGLVVICGNCGARVPYSEKIFKEVKAQNFLLRMETTVDGIRKDIALSGHRP